MPAIVAFECSSGLSSVALLADGEVVERAHAGDAAKKSRTLLATMSALLAERQLGLGDVSAFAFGAGPGAFTGVRTACSLAQGLALARGVSIVPICSLDALAQHVEVRPGGRVLAAMDARLEQLYVATYSCPGGVLVRDRDPECVPLGSVELDAGEWVGVGSAFSLSGPVLSPTCSGGLRSILAEAVPRAAQVATLAAAATDLWQDPAGVAPLYVRNNVAMTVAERAALGFRS